YLENMNDRETIYTHLNVFETFNPVLPDAYKETDFTFLANIGPELQHNVIRQVKSKFIAMDTMNYWISGTLPALKQTISKVDAMIINDSEVKQLAETDNLFTGARKIQAMGPKTLIIKKGEHGSILVHNDNYFFCPAYPVENLYDPTGAGDTFAGGFMGYLAQVGSVNNTVLRQAVMVATAFASFCVEAFGVQRLKQISAADIKSRVQNLLEYIEINPQLLWEIE
ncbi:sugar kinase, partial [candidate division KSB1 bacterium]|nr:sugar kinase [candidate division KSB1 bacterium]